MKAIFYCAVVLMLCADAVPLLAKGPTTRIVITGASLDAPIEITNARVLRQFLVWAGAGTRINGVEQMEGFIIDWQAGAVSDRPAGLPRYDVSFYVKYANQPLESQEEVLAYVVSFETDPRGGGYVFLPGRDDARYALNTKTMLRPGYDGQWFRSNDAWNRVATTVLREPQLLRRP